MTQSRQLGSATAEWDEGTLTVSTGVVERVWRRTIPGLATTGLRLLQHGRDWIDRPPDDDTCDWHVFHLMDVSRDRKSTRLNSSHYS